ncbi:Fimbrial protein [Pseudomonas simiae]|uniref:fimbrial protein n=1 Tax=Pseudomonas simiae TaxID=321846 RepID=UPI00084CF93B|nr:fimbrial protein [Pseudomonas simiae]SFB39404.1 Fimbrial protein [Pseudomonas simiae]
MRILNRILAIMMTSALPFSYVDAKNMEFSGIILAPPICTISDKDGRINVRFTENIAVNRIDGERYRQKIPYQFNCQATSTRSNFMWHATLTLKAMPAEFDPSALETSQSDLGIKVLFGGKVLRPNEPQEIELSASTDTELEAVPVKRIGAALPSTEFTASALLVAELY